MDMYFDKANVESFLHSGRDKVFDGAVNLMKKGSLSFYFAKSEAREIEGFGDFVKLLGSGATDGSNTIKWDVPLPARPLKSTLPATLAPAQLSSVYFLSGDDTKALISNGQLWFVPAGEEKKALGQMWMDDWQFCTNILSKINRWADLEPYVLPCTDIVICDCFILDDATLLDTNLLTLLGVLAKHARHVKLNLTIFTERKNVQPDWDKIATKIRNKIKTLTKAAPNVTIIAVAKKTLGEHDRTIFTNYRLFYSGDTLNYFDSSGKKITRGRTLHLHSLASPEQWDEAQGFISDMQGVVDFLKRNNPDLIRGDKKSFFLNFA